MHISRINSFNMNNNKMPSFKGVWGKTSYPVADYDNVMQAFKNTRYAYYFPFRDESRASINEVVNKNTSSRIVKGSDGKRQLLIQECRIGAPLSVTTEAYKKYSSIKSDGVVDDTDISTHVQIKDKFINSGFKQGEEHQISAINKAVVEILSKRRNDIA